jgi:hypothetical protein
MRILRLLCQDHETASATALRDAVAAFNRGLDIRLRFLSIGIEDRELEIGEGPDAAVAAERELIAFRPDAVVLLGDGAAAVAAATVAVRHAGVVAHFGAGRRDGDAADTARAVDHLSNVLLVLDDAGDAALREEGLGERVVRVVESGGVEDDPAFGPKVIKALRAARARSSGDSTC